MDKREWNEEKIVIMHRDYVCTNIKPAISLHTIDGALRVFAI